MKILKGMMLVLPVAMLFVMSCNESQGDHNEDTKVETEIADVKEDINDYRDEVYVANVLEENAEVIYLLELAQTKGTAAYIKDAAGKMKADHETLQQTFAGYAQTNNVDYEIKENRDNLATKEVGNDWDNDWNREMRNKHEKLLNKLDRKSDNASNPQLQQITISAIPVLREHLTMLEQYNK